MPVNRLRNCVSGLVMVLVLSPGALEADDRFHAGTSLSVVTQEHAPNELGGTTWGAAFVFGVRASRLLALDVEPAFIHEFTREVTGRPKLGPTREVSSRSETVFSFLVRVNVGPIEPVVGASYVRGRIRTVTSGSLSTVSRRSDEALAPTAGVDVALRVGRGFHVVPGVRMLLRPRDSNGSERATGLGVRLGVGGRVAF